MIRKEFIEKFNLTKTKTKCCFYDGTTRKTRTLYTDDKGTLFTIYNRDLHIVRPIKNRVDEF